jgi:hypothetical protein
MSYPTVTIVGGNRFVATLIQLYEGEVKVITGEFAGVLAIGVQAWPTIEHALGTTSVPDRPAPSTELTEEMPVQSSLGSPDSSSTYFAPGLTVLVGVLPSLLLQTCLLAIKVLLKNANNILSLTHSCK